MSKKLAGEAHEMRVLCAHTEMVDIDSLRPHPLNPNKHSEQQIQLFIRIMKYNGVRRAVTVSKRSGFMTKGHGQIMAMKRLGWKKAPIDRQEYENEAAEFADLVADNELARLSETDPDKLSEVALKMPKDFDFKLMALPEYVLPAAAGAPFVPGCDEDAVPSAPKEPVAKRGDIWQLGDHRVMCGDATAKEDVAALMGSEKADMVFTDPPYGISLQTNYHTAKPNGIHSEEQLRQTRNKYIGIINDDKPFNPAPILDGFRYCPEIFLFGADYYCKSIPEWGAGSIIVWDKKTPSSGISVEGAWGSDFELCWSKNRHKREIARIVHFGLASVENDKRVHPTQKPAKLAQWFFERWGKAGDLVADLFGGSGSTLIACEKTQRKCRMMEIDSIYCDVIVSRWEKYTGKKAKLISSSVKVRKA